jgi:outer membrane protein insertion porin family
VPTTALGVNADARSGRGLIWGRRSQELLAEPSIMAFLLSVFVLPARNHVRRLQERYIVSWLCFLTIITFLGNPSLSFGQSGPRIRSINIEGNKNLSTDEILDLLNLKRGESFSDSTLGINIAQLVRRYRLEGFYGAVVDSVSRTLNDDRSGVDISLYINEGEQTELGKLEIAGNHALSTEEILSNFESKEGRPLNQLQLESDIEALLKRYDEIGHPFAQVEVESLSMYEEHDKSKLLVRLDVHEGATTTIEEIKVEGNKDTKDYVILRELRLKPGEVYDNEKVQAIRQRLERLGLFSSVSDPELYMTKHGGGLLIKVKEGNSNTFDGILGYLPRGGDNQGGYFTGFVNVSLRNLFGTGRRLGVRWQRETQETQEVELHYLEPWVLGSPVTVGIGFLQREQDSTYVRRKIDLNGDLMLSENFTVSLLFGQDHIIPSSSLTGAFVSSSQTTTVGGEVRYDSRDDPYSPTGGILYRSDYQVGRKTVSGTSSASISDQDFFVKKFSLDMEFYLEPFSRQVIGTGLHAKDLRSDHIEIADLYQFGGTNTLRGYRENQFLGSSIAWSNLEYRFLMGRRTFLFGFLDTGYYFRPADDLRGAASSQAFKVGYGVGFRVDTSLGVLSVSYALGQGDTFNTGKIHFGIVNQF